MVCFVHTEESEESVKSDATIIATGIPLLFKVCINNLCDILNNNSHKIIFYSDNTASSSTGKELELKYF